MDVYTSQSGDFLGDFALLGNTEWGESTMIGVPNVYMEATASSYECPFLMAKSHPTSTIVQANIKYDCPRVILLSLSFKRMSNMTA